MVQPIKGQLYQNMQKVTYKKVWELLFVSSVDRFSWEPVSHLIQAVLSLFILFCILEIGIVLLFLRYWSYICNLACDKFSSIRQFSWEFRLNC